ncbi:MAG: hypothetical protein DBX47_01000 [Clostridiales bacterium]|nr:MAG: hypothetical protein DBX47_01000 [Clostridiales bacterium]
MNDPNMLFVCAMGMGVVFCGLIILIFLSWAVSSIIKARAPHKEEAQPKPIIEVKQEPIANRQEFVAAISAVIAEQLGTDINAIRIKSIKKV